ncbi:MAG: helix-turn-helix domain-containing protein [Anaerolineae bacterium]
MNVQELCELIRDGETETVEFKRFGISTNAIAETVVCLANSKGGLLLLGVEDRRCGLRSA